MKRPDCSSLLILFVTLPWCMFAACSPVGEIADPYYVRIDRQMENLYYVPSKPNTPLSADKNALNFEITSSSGDPTSGVDLQTSFLPTERLGIIAGYSMARDKGTESIDKVNQKRFELGAGYLVPLSKGWHYETYAGIGTGNIRNNHHTGNSMIRHSVYFVQPAIAYNNPKRTFTFGFLSRFSGVNFSVREQYFIPERELYTTGQFLLLHEKPFHLMWEPALVIKGGWRNFKFHLSYTYSADLTNSELQRQSELFSIGASLSFDTRKSRK